MKLINNRNETWKRWVGFQVLTAAIMKVTVFCYVGPRRLIEVYLRFSKCLSGDDIGSKHL
jgi:hypothetical protein